MKKSLLPVNKTFILTLAAISFGLLCEHQPSFAESTQTYSPLDANSGNLVSPTNTDFSLMGIIHRANFGTIQWNPEQQSQQLDSAAADFKAKQQKLIQTQQQNPGASLTTSGESKPPGIVLPPSK